MSVVTLTYRQLTKEDSFFLVQYQEDDSLQVRGRGFLHTDEKIIIGNSYRVQYEQEMRAEKIRREKTAKTQQPKQQPKPTKKPVAKRRKIQQEESSKENTQPSNVQACLLSQVRRLAGNLCRPLCDANSHLTSLLKQAAKRSYVAPRLCCKQTYCTASASVDAGVGQVSKEEKQFGKTKAKEIASIEILKNLSEDERIKLERLKTEYQSWKAEMRVVPMEVRNQDWVKLMGLDTKASRKKHFQYLALTEIRVQSREQKKEKKRLAREKRKQEMEDVEKGSDTYIHHISEKKLKHGSGKMNASQAMLFGNPFVFDFNVGVQREREAKNLLQQLDVCYGVNKQHPEPFHIHFTGIPQTGPLAEEFKWRHTWNAFIDFHNKDIHEVFPMERLVYLTPQSTRYLDYNADDIYVMGALVDLHDQKPYTFAKAKKLRLRTACIPLDKFYRLKKVKSLPLDIVYKIMLDVNLTRDWEKALIHVPHRFWADVKTPKLRQLWEEKLEQERFVRKKLRQQRYGDAVDAETKRENTQEHSDYGDSEEIRQ